ncbi:MAG: heavy metal-responsive transcriptional regulator [Anaerolineae bacterium]|nr:heavy metal-responsive transcriptional regulator [Anaerolineae bacterium]MDQ7034539.1 heavy metal-responsive transcriptional regulator [Anaerolineae bacterium]
MMVSIGQLSQQTGISTETIRYYERIALLPPAKRAANGYRQYDERDIERLLFIKRSRALDFTLNDIREILAFRERNEPPCQYVMTVMETQIDEIEQRIHDLEQLRSEIKALHEAGQSLPDDVQMKTCVCHLIQTSV